MDSKMCYLVFIYLVSVCVSAGTVNKGDSGTLNDVEKKVEEEKTVASNDTAQPEPTGPPEEIPDFPIKEGIVTKDKQLKVC